MRRAIALASVLFAFPEISFGSTLDFIAGFPFPAPRRGIARAF